MCYRPNIIALLLEGLRVLLQVLLFAKLEYPVDPEKSVLVILDPLEEYESLWTCRAALRRLVTDARESGVPIVVTRWARTATDPPDQLQRKGHWTTRLPRAGTVMEDVRSWVGEDCPVVDVVFTDAWTNETFAALVGDSKQIVFSGMWTEACVLNTVRSTAYRNIEPVVCRDACAGHFPQSLQALCAMQSVFGEVVQSVAFRPP